MCPAMPSETTTAPPNPAEPSPNADQPQRTPAATFEPALTCLTQTSPAER
jgi:hypothetical protein